ncbi:MFS transporter [Paenibacillus macerans]|uniref:MFS transporter n=1 Tax=Paenibacillus macerans TaxID=44252 RepID=UPI00203CF207|nr:MFS transporter [Paenibacillus macerans]MCM3702641.1 MFS transporter [Paenibacillus macerans]
MIKSWKVYILAIISFLVGTSEFVIAGILDLVSRDVGVTIAAAGQLISVYSISYAVGTPILIAATSKLSRRTLMLAALALFFIGNIITVVSTGYPMLVGARVILALSTGVFTVVALTVSAQIAGPGKQGTAIATIMMGFNLSLILGVPVGRVIASTYDWKMIFYGIGLLSFIAMLVILMALPKSQGEANVPLKEQLALLKRPQLLLTLSISFFWMVGYTIIYTFITPFLMNITGMSNGMVSIALFSFGIASLLGAQVGGYGADKLGIPRTLNGSLMIHAGILILMSIFAHTSIAVFPLLLLWSFFAWSTGPIQQVYMIGLAPSTAGILLSLNTSFIQLGIAVGAAIGGLVVESFSLQSIGVAGAIGVAIALLPAILSFSMRSQSADGIQSVTSKQ